MRCSAWVASVVSVIAFGLNAPGAVHSGSAEDVAKIAVGPKTEAEENSVTADVLSEHDSVGDREPAAAPTATPAPKRKAVKPAKVATPVAKPAAVQDVSDANSTPASSAVDGEAEDNVDKPVKLARVQSAEAPVGVEPTEAWAETPAPSPTPSTKTTSQEEEEVEAPTVPVPTVPKVAAPAAPPVEATVAGTTAEQSQKWLMNGNLRFMTKKFRADGRSELDRLRTSKEQKPHALVLSCSDSRVPPEMIFDQGLGEITTIRVAGEVLDASVLASIEQVVLNQAPHLLVVLGHTQCDSIEATLKWKELASHGSEALDRMVAEIKPHLKTVSTQNPSPKLQVEGALQADGVARDLTERSSIIKKAVDSGQLKIKSALYWIDTGEVRFY